MNQQRAAELQSMLEGVPLPAQKDELLAYAREQDESAEADMQQLPDRKYSSLDEVGEALAPVQPSRSEPRVEQPHEESGKPPGGDDYVEVGPEPGAVRHDAPSDNPPQKTLEQQTKTQKKQKQRQETLG